MDIKEKITIKKIYETTRDGIIDSYRNASTKGKVAIACTALGFTTAFGGLAAHRIHTNNLTTPIIIEYRETRNEFNQLRNSLNTIEKEALQIIKNTKTYNEQDLEEIVRPWTKAMQEKKQELEQIQQHPEVDKYQNKTSLPTNISLAGIILAVGSYIYGTSKRFVSASRGHGKK